MDIFNQYPQLREARQPPKLPLRDGSWSYKPAAVFAELVSEVEAGAFRLRAPAESVDGLIQFRGLGACLDPVFKDGDFCFIDPTLEPADGDFVVLLLDPAELEGIIERGRDDPKWVAMYGPSPGPIVTKILKSSGSEWYLQDKKTAFSLLGWAGEPRDNRILGVVRRHMRGGCALYDAPVSHAIEANAVSQIASNLNTTSSSCVTNVSSPISFAASAVSATVTATGNPLSIDVSGSYQAIIAGGATLSSVKLFITVNGVQLASGGFFLDNSGNPNANPIQFTVVATDTQPAGTVCTYGLMGTIAGTTGSFSHVQLQVFQPYLKVRDYKK